MCCSQNVSGVEDAVQNLLPGLPLNTDGIDPSGTNITIEDCYIENYDDAVAVKVLCSWEWELTLD